jgi:hypothetical protein
MKEKKIIALVVLMTTYILASVYAIIELKSVQQTTDIERNVEKNALLNNINQKNNIIVVQEGKEAELLELIKKSKGRMKSIEHRHKKDLSELESKLHSLKQIKIDEIDGWVEIENQGRVFDKSEKTTISRGMVLEYFENNGIMTMSNKDDIEMIIFRQAQNNLLIKDLILTNLTLYLKIKNTVAGGQQILIADGFANIGDVKVVIKSVNGIFYYKKI